MEERAAPAGWPSELHARFELAPPRHFLLPALLLLVSEHPGYGYRLVKDLQELRLGRVDRPSVYRALAQLEKDGLLESWSDTPKAGQARRVYGPTALGDRALRAWMGVIKEERDGLDRVLRRYAATGTIDAVLAEVEGGWGAVVGHGWSPVSSTSPAVHRAQPQLGSDRKSESASSAPPATGPARRRFTIVPDRSVILIEARSSVGPITFGGMNLSGHVEVELDGCTIIADRQPAAHLSIPVSDLRSGNGLYDAELLRRIDARRYPIATIDLTDSCPIGTGDRYRVDGELTLHGVTRALNGTVSVGVPEGDTLLVTGEQVFDIRDFDIASPTVLMLRIYPDVMVRVHLEAELESGGA